MKKIIIVFFTLVVAVFAGCATTQEQSAPSHSEYHLAVYIPETAEIHSEPHADFLDAILDVEEQAERFRVCLTEDTNVFVLVQKNFPDGSCQSLGDFSGSYIRSLAEARAEADGEN